MNIEAIINQKYKELNATERGLAAVILNNQEEIVDMTIRELADACHSSKSTVLRFIKKLGLSGFSELKYVLKWQEQLPEAEKPYKDDLVNDIRLYLDQLVQWDFYEICETIANADRIYAYGTGTEQKLCTNEIKRYFWRVQKYIHIIDDEMDFHALIPDLTNKDLVIIVSLSGNTPTMIPYAKRLAAKKVPILSMTEMRNNELAQITSLQMYALANSRKGYLTLDITTFSTFFIMTEALFRSYLDYLHEKDQLK